MKDGLQYFVPCVGILLPGPDWVKSIVHLFRN